MPRPEGNRAKRAELHTDGPWAKWRIRRRHARAIRFIETYCRPPKGVGYGQPMKLARWQKEWLEETLAPNVDAAVMALPRGNGKSTFAAAIATWALFDADANGGAPQVPIVATTVSQAMRSVYNVAASMVYAEPELAQRSLQYTAIGASRVTFPFRAGEMFPIANDVDGLQGLDPSVAVVDEVGFQPVESWDALLLASGKRPSSLVMGLGTPGVDRDNALWHLRSKWREGATLPRFRFHEYAADEGCDIADREQWRKANPAMVAGYLQEHAIETALGLAPEAHFRIFRLGQWVEGTDCWLGSSGHRVWENLLDPYEFVDGAQTWVGVDIALKHDSSSVVAIQQREDGRYHAKCHLWVPARDEPVDTTDIMQYLRDLHEKYAVEAISFDPRFFDVPAKMLSDEGLPMLEVPQSVDRMTVAIGATYELIQKRQLSHDDDPHFAAQVLNAVPRFTDRGFTLQKSKSRGLIDAAIAMALAVERAQRPAERKEILVSWR